MIDGIKALAVSFVLLVAGPVLIFGSIALLALVAQAGG